MQHPRVSLNKDKVHLKLQQLESCLFGQNSLHLTVISEIIPK